MEDNLLTLDASNASIGAKIKNPVGDGASFSAHYSANCGKHKICPDKAGNPAWVSLVFGGAASGKKMICYGDNFEECFGGFQKAMHGQAGQEFTIGMLADKGRLRCSVDGACRPGPDATATAIPLARATPLAAALF